MKRLGIILGLLCSMSLSMTYAQVVDADGTHAIGGLSCNGGTFSETYYAGTNGHQPSEEFYGSQDAHWTFAVNDGRSYISVADPNTLLTMPTYNWVSNGKPKNIDSVLVWSTNGSIAVSDSVPTTLSPGDIAAQIVFRLYREPWDDGPSYIPPYTFNYCPLGGSCVPNEQIILAGTSGQPIVDNECLNIYLERCGDGIIQAEHGEECDGGPGCTETCTEISESMCGDVDYTPLPGECNYGQDSYPLDDCDPGYSTTPPAPTCMYCAVDCSIHTLEGTYCGDGIIQTEQGEECDGGSGCTETCTEIIIDPVCPEGTDYAGTPGQTPGTSCNDGDATTENDVVDSTGCNCAGTPIIIDPVCPEGTDYAGTEGQEPGSECDDGDATTENDVVDSTGCNCAGTPIIIDPVCPEGTDYAGTEGQEPGSECDDGDATTENDVVDSTGCNCAGTPIIIDPVCPEGTDYAGTEGQEPGSECDDGDATTENDVVDSTGCNCNGTPIEPESVCEWLQITTTDTQAPYTYTFVCEGIGQDYEIILTNSNDEEIASWDTSTASYTFTEEDAGEYHVECFVDGVSGEIYSHGSPDGVLAEFPYQGGQTIQEYTEYVQYQQTSSIVEESISTLDWNNTTPATSSIHTLTVQLPDPYPQLTQTYTVVQEAVNETYSNPCAGDILIPESPGSECGDGIIEGTEQCEEDTDCPGSKTCNDACRCTGGGGTGGDNYCGDGDFHPELGEECDDGNIENNDGCDENCNDEGGGGGGGGGRTGGDNYCGDGVVRNGEMCDDGGRNGLPTSICSSNCGILKGLDPAKCEFVDPPSIQLGEILPYRRGIEESAWIEDDINCTSHSNSYDRVWSSAQDIGKIDKDSMICHFQITAPDGDVFYIDEPCFADEFTSSEVERYRDFLSDKNIALEGEWGTSIMQTKKLMSTQEDDNVYGEYTIELYRVEYDMCVGEGEEIYDIDDEGNEYRYIDTTIDGMVHMEYEGRICQYNFAVTSPYMIQKGVSLSSTKDNIATLKRFLDINGDSVLSESTLTPIDTLSTVNAQEVLEEEFTTYSLRASEYVTDVNHALGGLSALMKKVPGQEIYYTNQSIILPSTSPDKPFNAGKPTTLLIDEGRDIIVAGSFYGNVLLLNPKGSVVFTNTDCDEQDTVQGIFLANDFKTNHTVYGETYTTLANVTTTKPVRCDGGGLIVEGILLGGSDASTLALRDARRSTLTNWFDSSIARDVQIFDGASLRVQGSVGIWDALPPITKTLFDVLWIRK